MSIPAQFTYVFIPVTGPPQVISHAQVTLEDDQFIARVKAHFSASEASISEDVLRTQISQNAPVSAHIMDTILSSGVSIDIFSLSLPVKATGFFNVSIYCDDKSIAKNLPVNLGANSLAKSCGVKSQSFRGDVFVSRVFDDNENDWYRADLNLSDFEASAAWQIQARELNERKAPVSMSSLTQKFAEAQRAGWTDEGESVEVRVEAGQATKKDVSVVIKVDRLLVSIGGVSVLDSPLFRKVSPSDSSWVLSEGKIVINLEKTDAATAWSSLAPVT